MDKYPVKGYIKEEEKQALQNYCKKHGDISEASVVRAALREYLKEEFKK